MRSKQWSLINLLCASLTALLVGSSCTKAEVTFDWATVGDPGNAPNEIYSYWHVGEVDYRYRISKYEVTNAQYAEFLNAVDPLGANSLGLFDYSMWTDSNGGISFDQLAAEGTKYYVRSRDANRPVTYVNYFDAMRFVNWLHNGQGSGSTENGAYRIETGTNERRREDARYFLPTEDEWHKAAYYDPLTASYFDYPTSSNEIPTSEPAPGGANSANYRDPATGEFAVTGSSQFELPQNYLTEVGSYTESASPYGTYDQGGNVWEWTEAIRSSRDRGLNGGSWYESYLLMQPTITAQNVYVPTRWNGFRVASLPEEGTPLVSFGAIADLQYADRDPVPAPPNTKRWFRSADDRLDAIVRDYNIRSNLDFVIQLGNLIHSEWESFDTMLDLPDGTDANPDLLSFRDLAAPAYHVVGNLDFNRIPDDPQPDARDDLNVRERLGFENNIGYYDLAVGQGYHLVVLDDQLQGLGDQTATYVEQQMAWADQVVQTAWAAGEKVILLEHLPMSKYYNGKALTEWESEVARLIEAYPNIIAHFSGHLLSGPGKVFENTLFDTLGGNVASDPDLDQNLRYIINLYEDHIDVEQIGENIYLPPLKDSKSFYWNTIPTPSAAELWAIPEPSTIAILAAGVCGMIVTRSRR